jgi:hypothetical protein
MPLNLFFVLSFHILMIIFSEVEILGKCKQQYFNKNIEITNLKGKKATPIE